MEIISVIIFSALYVVQYVVVMILGIRYASKTENSQPSPKSVSIVIPFRNEEKRIDALLKSINRASIPQGIDCEFIFVDDGSSDNGADKIQKELRKQFKIITSSGRGKKTAILTAANEAQHEYILTWDADISFEENYFEALLHLRDADMWILPVKMTGNHLLQRLTALDFSWLQVLTYTRTQTSRPLLANGANLLFKRDKYFEAEKERTDGKIASGDDVFLLAAFENLGADIKASNNHDIQVSTPAPASIKEIFTQRKRWSGKMREFETEKEQALQVFFAFTQLFMIGAYFILFSWPNIYMLIPIGLKFFNEYLITQFYTRGRTFVSDIFVVFISQFWYPIYLVLIVAFPSSKDDRWAD